MPNPWNDGIVEQPTLPKQLRLGRLEWNYGQKRIASLSANIARSSSLAYHGMGTCSVQCDDCKGVLGSMSSK